MVSQPVCRKFFEATKDLEAKIEPVLSPDAQIANLVECIEDDVFKQQYKDDLASCPTLHAIF